jgi:hypothetical protein
VKRDTELKPLIEDWKMVNEEKAAHIPISVSDIATGIAENLSISTLNAVKKGGVQVPEKTNKSVTLSPQRLRLFEEHFEVVHKDINQQEVDEAEIDNFYRGGVITWRGLSKNQDIRRKNTEEFKRIIEEALHAGESEIFYVIHEPGMGGTTISRRIAFDLREKYPTVILKQYRLLDTADKIVELYDQTKKTIFVVAEAHQFSRDNIYELYMMQLGAALGRWCFWWCNGDQKTS